MDTGDRLLTADEAAALLNVSRFRIYELARTGIVPAVRLGRQVRFSCDALTEFIRDGGRALSGEGGWRRP